MARLLLGLAVLTVYLPAVALYAVAAGVRAIAWMLVGIVRFAIDR